MLRIIFALVFALTNIFCFADYSDRGRPSDYQDHHDGPLTYIYLGVGAIIVIAFLGVWIYDKIITHKKQISDALGTIFAGLLIFGGILLLGKCGEALHNSLNSKGNNKEQIESTEYSGPSNTSTPSYNAPTYQYTPQNRIQHFIIGQLNITKIAIIVEVQERLSVLAAMEQAGIRKFVVDVMEAVDITGLDAYIVMGKVTKKT